MLNYHHEPKCSWTDHWQLYWQVVMNQGWKSIVIAYWNDNPKLRINNTRRVERKPYHHCTQVRQSECCITRRKGDALVKLYQSATIQMTHVVKTQSCTSSRDRRSPAKTVRFSGEPVCPKQIAQRHVSGQPDTVDGAALAK